MIFFQLFQGLDTVNNSVSYTEGQLYLRGKNKEKGRFPKPWSVE